MKLYKFRSLGSDTDLQRAKDTLSTGKFWCSRFWELNDPMEGVFRAEVGWDGVQRICNEKAARLICSFSKAGALTNPLMWGYYANGFKGIAIEVSVPVRKVLNVQYVDTVSLIRDLDAVEEILTTKLEPWQHEQEARFICKGGDHEKPQKVGKITGLYVGMPYINVGNYGAIEAQHTQLSEYHVRVGQLVTDLPEGITLYRMQFQHSTLVHSPAAPGDFQEVGA